MRAKAGIERQGYKQKQRQGHRQKLAGAYAEATIAEQGASGWVKGRKLTAALDYWKKCVLACFIYSLLV